MHALGAVGSDEGVCGGGSSGQIPFPITTTSIPVAAGPTTPIGTSRTIPLGHSLSPMGESADPKDGECGQDLAPDDIPKRPRSTPFPEQGVDGEIPQLYPDGTDDWMTDESELADEEVVPQSTAFQELPVEIYECILDHLFGVRTSASNRTTAPGKSKLLRSWGKVFRHSRRREVSELALVSAKWRQLIQERLYRHLKIKGTRDSMDQAVIWFLAHPHLCAYIKHIEIWFPVFQQKNSSPVALERSILLTSTDSDRPSQTRVVATLSEHGGAPIYQSPTDNCTLEDAFRFVALTFANAVVLTLEGGERRKPPQVKQFMYHRADSKLPVLASIETLVCKGQWNIIRTNEDFQTISNALPNLREWHGTYAKPKSKSYLCMATIVTKLPLSLTHLNICLENDYRKELEVPPFFKKVARQTHFCMELAQAVPTLEHLAYTGRICHCFFDQAAKLSNPRTSRLRTIELVVKNCCRQHNLLEPRNGSGLTDISFISAFEALVLCGVRALDRLSAVNFLRIRFIDLDSQVPPLNPYFEMERTRVTGIWSDGIVAALKKTRPAASFVEMAESLGDIELSKDGLIVPGPSFSKIRPLSIKVANYARLVPMGITIS